MQAKLTDMLWLNEHNTITLTELAEMSGLSSAELHELIDYGVIDPVEAGREDVTFYAHCVTTAKVAHRLRDDFELDTHGVALALTLIERMQELEARIRELRARIPGGGV